MKITWMIIPLLLLVINIDMSSAQESIKNDPCVDLENPSCDEQFVPQSVWIFSVVDSSVGIFKDRETKLTIVDIGTFYGLGGNGTVPDTIEVYRDDVLWKTTTKDTGIAPSTSHSDWQLPQTFFFNELPGLYKVVLFTNNTKTLVYEFMVKQINEKLEILIDVPETTPLVSSPLKQIKNGVLPSEIICKEDLQLVFKNSNDDPVCVKPSSINKLIDRNWIKY